MGRTARPAPSSSRAVPPVDTISIPSSASPRAKSTSPRLSDTVSSARRTCTPPGSVTSSALSSVVAISHLLDDHLARRAGIDPYRAGREQPHGTRQQPVLDLVDPILDSGDVPRIRINRESLLHDDRAGVDALVDEMHRHPHLLDAVVECLLDRPQAREGREERRVHVDDPAREAPDERLAQQLHEAGEHDELRAALLEPVADRPVTRTPIPVVGGLVEHARLDPGGRRAIEPAGVRAVRRHADHLDAVPPMHLVEDRLEVRALARYEHGDAHAHAGTGAAGASSTGYGPSVVCRRFSSISSSIRARMSARRMFAEVPYAGRPL